MGAVNSIWATVRFAVDEGLLCDAADVGLGDGVDLRDLAEHLAPVAVAGLVFGELLGQSGVVGQAAELISLGAGLELFELRVGDILVLHAVQFLVDRIAHFLVHVAGQRDSVEGE